MVQGGTGAGWCRGAQIMPVYIRFRRGAPATMEKSTCRKAYTTCHFRSWCKDKNIDESCGRHMHHHGKMGEEGFNRFTFCRRWRSIAYQLRILSKLSLWFMAAICPNYMGSRRTQILFLHEPTLAHYKPRGLYEGKWIKAFQRIKMRIRFRCLRLKDCASVGNGDGCRREKNGSGKKWFRHHRENPVLEIKKAERFAAAAGAFELFEASIVRIVCDLPTRIFLQLKSTPPRP